MELVYLWIEDYKNIHKQGFNFSPRFECTFHDEYDKDGKLKDNCQLEIIEKKEDEYIKDFFGENINVTAIVGKNGSGKSSVLECLSDTPKVVFYLHKNIFYSNIKVITNSSYSVIQLKEKLDFLFNPSYDYYFRNLENFDSNTRSEEISFFKTEVYKHLTTEEVSCASEFMRSEEVKNFVLFSYEKKLLIPKNILFIFENYSDFEINTEHPLFKLNVIKRMSLLDSLYIEGFYLLEQIIEQQDKALLEKYKQIVQYYLKENNEITCSKELFLNFFNFLNDEILRKLYNEVLKFYDLFNNFDEKYMKIYDYNGIHKITNSVYIVPFNDIDFIYNVILHYTKLISPNYGDLFHLKFDWEGTPSSGEFIWLNTFFKIYYELKENIEIKHILLDEGESFLHPNWQKKYLSYIVQFIKDNFPNRTIHIILTSHSPFLLSDIPKQNIIFLDKDENGKCIVVDGLNEKKQTFGANIHTLLSDSFFMEDGLMGEFAKGKIDDVIQLLNKEKLDEKELKYCEQIISIVGEPIVKNQLQRMLDSKRLKKVDEIDKIYEEIELLKHRIEILRKD